MRPAIFWCLSIPIKKHGRLSEFLERFFWLKKDQKKDNMHPLGSAATVEDLFTALENAYDFCIHQLYVGKIQKQGGDQDNKNKKRQTSFGSYNTSQEEEKAEPRFPGDGPDCPVDGCKQKTHVMKI